MIEVIESPPQTYTRKRRYQLMGTDVHSSDYAIQKLQQEHRGLRGLGDDGVIVETFRELIDKVSSSNLANISHAYQNPLPAPSGTAKAVDAFTVPNDIIVYARYGYALAKRMFTNQTLTTYGREALDAWGMAMWAYQYAGTHADISFPMSDARNQNAWQQIRVGNGWADKARKIAPVPPGGGGGGGGGSGTVKPPVEDKKDAIVAKLEWYKTGVGMAGIGLAGAALLFLMFRKKPEPDYRQLTP